MKGKYLLLVGLTLASMITFGQPSTAVSQIPANVKSTFEHYYPNAGNVTWEQEGAYYIPSFTSSNGVTGVHFLS